MSTRPSIQPFLQTLSSVPCTAQVHNPYCSAALLRNLECYLEGLIKFPYSSDLLVGEAPGYAGCALTGIPFTSQRVIATSKHPLMAALRPKLSCNGTKTEGTSTIVWGCLETGSRTPAFWNAFPFHPHPPRNLSENREPTSQEVTFGAGVLNLVMAILKPQRVFAVGRCAEGCLRKYLPALQVEYICHPSNGRSRQFMEGLKAHGVI